MTARSRSAARAALLSLALTACVTINVYFPAAEAKEAAKQFVEKVIGDEAQPATQPEQAPEGDDGGMATRLRFDPLMLIGIAPAYAQGAPDTGEVAQRIVKSLLDDLK